MNSLFRILILEDDLATLSILIKHITILENEIASSGAQIAITVLSESTQVDEYINNTQTRFDVILLDRDCKAGASFHVLDIQKYGAEKIIGISSIPSYNDSLSKLGITRIVPKDYTDLNNFSKKVIVHIRELLK